MAITNTTGETFPAGASVVTATKLNNIVNNMTTTMATAKVLGRATAGTGAVEELATTGTGSVVLATSPTLVTPALGTPASGVVTNLTGTASININGTVGATTPSTGVFTSVGVNSATPDSHVIVGDTGPSVKLVSDFASPNSSTRGAIVALCTSNGQYSLTDGEAMIGLYGNSRGNLNISPNYSGTGTVKTKINSALDVSGVATLADTTDASSSTTGALKTAGGLGVAKKLYVGTDLDVTGNTTKTGTLVVSNTTDASSSTTGSVKTAGGLGVAKKLYVGTDAHVAGAITGSSLVLNYGIGALSAEINGVSATTVNTDVLSVDIVATIRNLTATGTTTCSDTTDSSSSTTGSVQMAGGLGVAKKLYVGTDLNVGGIVANSGGIKVLAANMVKTTSTSLSTITGMSVDVVSGNTYIFEFNGYVTQTNNGGWLFATGGTSTRSSSIGTYTAVTEDGNTYLAYFDPNSQVGDTTVGATDAACISIKGSFVCSGSGTLLMQFAQAGASGSSTLLNGAFFRVMQA